MDMDLNFNIFGIGGIVGKGMCRSREDWTGLWQTCTGLPCSLFLMSHLLMTITPSYPLFSLKLDYNG